MNWQQLKNEANKLSAIDRLALVEALVHSVTDELEPSRQVSAEILAKLRGCLKTDAPTPTDREVEAILQQGREEKYL